MIHMPSHIYQRVGRYADAMKSNQLAIAADEDYISAVPCPGDIPHDVLPAQHSLSLVRGYGRWSKQAAIKSARKLASKIDDAALEAMPLTAVFRMVPYWALARFGILEGNS